MRVWTALVMSIAALGALAQSRAWGDEPADRPVDFNRDIRPILSDVCFQCHGPDKNHRKADLRLDVKDDAYNDRGGYKLIFPGKLGESELYARLVDSDETQRMPPPQALRQLTKDEIELFKRWIEQGAEWKGHWAYLKPERPAIPDVVDEQGFVKNPIDNFLLRRMREKGRKKQATPGCEDRPTG